MILIDPRAGSKELITPLLLAGYEVQKETLDYGDVAFFGNGPDGPLKLGIEYKKFDDFLQSMEDDRLMGHQIPGMMDEYDRVHLLIEGTPMLMEDGGLKNYEPSCHRWRRPHGNVSLRRVLSFVCTIQEHGVIVTMLPSQGSIVSYIAALYTWWQKAWDKHARLYVHTPAVNLIVPSLRQKVALLLPGIGQGKLMAIESKFDCVRSMINAKPVDWQSVPGVGKKTAEAIEEALVGSV